MHSLSASWPAWPKGVWPRSCARQIASASVSLSRSARATVRADLRHFERMREARAVQVALVVHEHLGLVDEAAERVGMDDAVAVALELAAEARRGLGIAPAADCARRSRHNGASVLAHALTRSAARRVSRSAASA